MASTPLFFSLFLASLSIHGFMAKTSADQNSTSFICTSCSRTTYPALCVSSLSRYADRVGSDPVLLARFAMNTTYESLGLLSARINAILRHFPASSSSPGNPVLKVLKDCRVLISDATDQVRRSEKEVAGLEEMVGSDVAWRIANAQTWVSAALTDESTCTDELDGGGTGGGVETEVSRKVIRVKRLTSNALALVANLHKS